MKRIADAFVYLTAPLIIPPTIKDAAPAFYENHAQTILLSSVAVGLLLSLLSGVDSSKSSGISYWLKHEIFNITNITIFLLCFLLIDLISVIVFPAFHLSVSSSSILYSTTIGLIYVLFLL